MKTGNKWFFEFCIFHHITNVIILMIIIDVRKSLFSNNTGLIKTNVVLFIHDDYYIDKLFDDFAEPNE